MSVVYEEGRVRLAGAIEVEAAEGLLEWLQAHPAGQVDLAGCEHLHAACLQVLMAAEPQVGAWPRDPDLAGWLRDALQGDRP